uniref:Uncharacterized protein n=1 Tax=Anguilla anguilla TaxID=7936 RepID=A0A0E9QKE8_ANGAN
MPCDRRPIYLGLVSFQDCARRCQRDGSKMQRM